MSTITIRPFLAAKLLTFAALTLGGCHWTGIRGNGHIVTENRPVEQFSSVEAEGAFDIEWTQGPASCTIRTDENLLRHVETSMSGNKLRLEWHGQLHPTHGMKVKLSSGSMSGARLTGAVRLSATPGAIRHRAAISGEHTDEVLSGLGFSAAEINALKQEGAI